MADTNRPETPSSRRSKKLTLREQVESLDFELSRTRKLIEISERMAEADTLDESLEEFLTIIQNEANAYEVALWLGQALANKGDRTKLTQDLVEAASRLGEPGVHERAAHEIGLLFTD